MELSEKKTLLRKLLKEAGRGSLGRLARALGVGYWAAQNWVAKKGTGWVPAEREEEMWAFFEYALLPNGNILRKVSVTATIPAPDIVDRPTLEEIVTQASDELMRRRSQVPKADAMAESLQALFANHKDADRVKQLLAEAGRIMEDYVRREEAQLHAAARNIIEAIGGLKNGENSPQEQKTATARE